MDIEKVVYRHYRVSEVDLPYAERMVSNWNKRIPVPDFLHGYSRREKWIGGDRLLSVPANDERPAPRGGVTMCLVYLSGIDTPAIGLSVCSLDDNFNYYRGRQIAYGRAVQSIEKETWIDGPRTFFNVSLDDPRFPTNNTILE